jgi:4-alpha-glucanotransferase
MSVGAPPDILNTGGQNWGLAGFNPSELQDRQFEPFCRTLAASMRYSGAIRVDHILGFQRLYVIPEGMSARDGAYIRFPFEALLAATTLLSLEHKCIVIGEDLGTVPDRFREILADWGLWSYQVMLFERTADGAFSTPESYRENALVAFATHDLPTFTGWITQQDLAIKEGLGINPGETREERANAVTALCRVLKERSMELNFHSVAKYLAETPARLLMIGIEDVLALPDQINLPGTTDQYPNWRRRLPLALEDLAHSGLRELANMFEAAGRRGGGREPKVTEPTLSGLAP